MKKTSTIITISALTMWVVLLSTFSFLPSVVEAQGTTNRYKGLVQCDGVTTDAFGTPIPGAVKCDFKALINQIKYIISWIFGISIPFMIIMLAWGGLLYMTGEEKKMGEAKTMFWNIGKGFIIMLAAWAIVYTLLTLIVDPVRASWITSLLGK